jgi:glycogen synthase
MKACTLDAVFSDGKSTWDNNNKQDFHAVVVDAAARHGVIRGAKAMEQLVAWREAREAQRRADAQRATQRAARAADAKEASLRVVQAQAARNVRTVPPEGLVAGEQALVLYNPDSTPLHRRSDLYLRGGYNRWRHDPRRWGPLRLRPATQEELDAASVGVPGGSPASAAGWYAAEVDVPSDVWSLDFVACDTAGDGGTYDNRGTMDYHLAVSGGTVIGQDGTPVKAEEPMLHVVSISVEMAPIAKVGGLGDVVTSLGRAVQDAGHRMEVILPKYDVLDYSRVKNFKEIRGFQFGGCFNRVWQGEVEGLTTLFIEPQNGMFSCGCIYGADFKPVPLTDAQRFGFFSHAALEFCLQSGRRPDVAHIHDWQTAPVARLYWDCYRNHGLPNTRLVFTIHNLNYGANLIAEAMSYSQRATTVSRTYADEIAGHPAIRPHGAKFRGVVNGIDPDIWDPLNDASLPQFYDESNLVQGKQAAKRALRSKLGMADKDVPIVGVVTRLTGQKGIHLIKHALYKALERGAHIALLGSAPDPRVQAEFDRMADDVRHRYHGASALVFKFDEPLSHIIYAASDLLLVPSMFEPCGLSQLIAMRYGTVPLVRRTGGLADTVFDVDTDRERAAAVGLAPNGFVFEGTDGAAIEWALNRALGMWYTHRAEFAELQRTCMAQDWSWNRPATEYLELYHAATRA